LGRLMKTLEYVPVPAFEDNYIWLVSDGHDAVVIDPGDAAPVEACLAKRGWHLTAILLTHHHRDHVGGVAGLLAGRSAEKIPVYGPAGESIEHLTQRLKQGDRISIAKPAFEFTVIDVPGHTAGHIALFQAADPQGVQMLASLDALAALPGATLVHCAHEYTLSNIRFARAADPANADLLAWQQKAEALRAQHLPTLPTTVAHERAVNPFLRVDDRRVQAALAAQFERPVIDRLDAFTLLRGWKDKFR